MNYKLTSRDFLNGTLIGAGALLLQLPAPLKLFAQSQQTYGFSGIEDYSASNGNTPEVIRLFQAIQRGDFDSIREADNTGETYDLVIVGGGLSGLGAAYEFKKAFPRQETCLILENHPIFGGAAKRNEFMVQGERLIGPQASNSFGIIDRPGIAGYDIYSEPGIPTEFEYGELPPQLKPPDFDATNFGYRLWFDSKSIGHYYNGQTQGTPGKWVTGFWENRLDGTPYSESELQHRTGLCWRDE